MPQIDVVPAGGTWTVRTDDGILVESRNAMALREGGLAPVIYFPRKDVAMAMMERTDTTSECPHKGTANYYALAGRSIRIDDAAWTYEKVTNPDAKAIEGYLAFYGSKVTIEQI